MSKGAYKVFYVKGLEGLLRMVLSTDGRLSLWVRRKVEGTKERYTKWQLLAESFQIVEAEEGGLAFYRPNNEPDYFHPVDEVSLPFKLDPMSLTARSVVKVNKPIRAGRKSTRRNDG